MPDLLKARLTAISSDPRQPGPLSSPAAMDVQFNPTTLRLQLANQVSGGRAPTHPARQYLGTGSRTLTVELVFDTADEGTTDAPRSVREKTNMVEAFALPYDQRGQKQAPPKVRFAWGVTVIEGIVDSVSIDFDHFAANGTPLRAKCALSIKEQDARWQLLESGAGANPAGTTPTPTAATAGAPGTSGSGNDHSAAALGGESAADFAARMGLDPAAWRGLAAGVASPLSLAAGLEIGFNATVGASLGVGISAGVSAGVSASLDASFGLDAGSGGGAVAPGPGAPAAAGFNLAAAGGVTSAVQSVKIARADTAQRDTKAAFAAAAGTPAVAGGRASTPVTGAAPARPGLPSQSRTPLARSGLPSGGTAAEKAPERPRVDPRAVGFGFGVPLRPTYGAAARERARGQAGAPPTTDDPTVPRWRELPVRSGATASAHRRGTTGCGCTTCRGRR